MSGSDGSAVNGKEPDHLMSDASPTRRQRSARSRAPDVSNRVAPRALERRQRAQRADVPPGFFASGLSVGEFVLAKAAGFDPVGIVLGTSAYPMISSVVGSRRTFESTAAQHNHELTGPTNALDGARKLALKRLVAEARALRADGVIGVHLDIAQRPGTAHILEFIAMGTAVRARGGPIKRPRARTAFTSDLSGQDVYSLMRAGYQPLGLVMGCSAYCGYQNGTQFLKTIGQNGSGVNGEIESFTEAVIAARRLAVYRLRMEAEALGAEGTAGVHVHIKPHLSKDDAEFRHEIGRIGKQPNWIWRSLAVEVYVYGTAISPRDTDQPAISPRAIIPLNI